MRGVKFHKAAHDGMAEGLDAVVLQKPTHNDQELALCSPAKAFQHKACEGEVTHHGGIPKVDAEQHLNTP